MSGNPLLALLIIVGPPPPDQATFASHPDPVGYRSSVVNLIEILKHHPARQPTIRLDPVGANMSVAQLGALGLFLFTPRFGPRKN